VFKALRQLGHRADSAVVRVEEKKGANAARNHKMAAQQQQQLPPPRPQDLTTMWKALEQDAGLIESLVTPLVRPESTPTLAELQQTVTALRHFQVTKAAPPGGPHKGSLVRGCEGLPALS